MPQSLGAKALGPTITGWRRAGLAVTALASFVAAGPAEAATRPDARALSCDQARRVVERSGAVVMTTGDYTYERFVANAGYCVHGEVARGAWTATSDEPACSIGWTCEDRFRRLRVR